MAASVAVPPSSSSPPQLVMEATARAATSRIRQRIRTVCCADVPTSAMTSSRPIAVVVGATSKWQAGGRNTLLAHGGEVDDSDLPVGSRWGIGGAVAQKFATEGFSVVLTTRTAANAADLQAAIREQGGECTTVELDLVSEA